MEFWWANKLAHEYLALHLVSDGKVIDCVYKQEMEQVLREAIANRQEGEAIVRSYRHGNHG